jgi:hypothetical protein
MATGLGISLARAYSRWGWIALAMVVIGGGVAFAVEPLTRREILFETPIRIVPGASVAGRFEPEHRGPFVIQLRFHEAWLKPLSEEPGGVGPELQALERDIGGRWRTGDDPPGFAASYTVRSSGRSISSGATGDHFRGFFGPRGVGVNIAWIDDGQPSPHEFDVRIDRAVDGLARWDARLVVAASGDWISYAGLEAPFRMAFAAVGVVIGLLLVYWLRRVAGRALSRPPAGSAVQAGH